MTLAMVISRLRYLSELYPNREKFKKALPLVEECRKAWLEPGQQAKAQRLEKEALEILGISDFCQL